MAEEEAPRVQRWVGTAPSDVCRDLIWPLLKREGIPYRPGQQSLGVIEFYAPTPDIARRARELIRKDALEKGYSFTPGTGGNP